MGILIIALAMAAAAWSGVEAQPAGCTTALTSLVPCMSYVTGNASTPSTACCSQLSIVVTNQVACLCTILNSTAIPGIGLRINQTQAVTLPGACNIRTPPISQCNALAGPPAPAPAPTESAASVPAPTESAASAPAPTETGTTPSTSPPSETTPSTPSTPAETTPSQSSEPSVPTPQQGSGTKTVPNKGVVSSARTNSALLSVPLLLVILSAVIY